MKLKIKNDRKNGRTEWLTPPALLQTLGPFDLDPCAPVDRPWPMAKFHYTIADDGLTRPWHGLVWCHPPCGPGIERWLEKCDRHGSAVALVYARTETCWFQQYCLSRAIGLFLFRGRLFFHHRDGTRAAGSAGAPLALVCWNRAGYERINRLRMDRLTASIFPGYLLVP